MNSKRRQEGWLLIDNRESPGVTDALMRTISPELPPGAGRGMFEAPTVTCSHCQMVIIINPLRTRDRAYCQKCDHYLCDACGLMLTQLGVCKTFKQIIEEVQEMAVKNAPKEVPVFFST